MNSTLKTWIAESESWQAFIDFNISKEAIADYPFLHRIDDFYLSLMNNCLKILRKDRNVSETEDVFAIAKGLEIYSLKRKRDSFKGVNHSDNILYSAGLYYLAGYSASAWILANIFPQDSYKTDVDVFNSCLLRKKLDLRNIYAAKFNVFLNNGNKQILDDLFEEMSISTEKALNKNSNEYVSLLLCKALVSNILKDNIWLDLLEQNNDPNYWIQYVHKCTNRKMPIWNFFPSQRYALKQGVLSERTFSLQMPTSSGKTFISEVIIFNEIKRNPNNKILYLAPFRALAAELKKTLATNLASLGISSKTIYGGNLPTVEERNSIYDASLIISTPEKFMAIENIFPGLSNIFTTIVCDEGHLLDDESRGLEFELLLSRLKRDMDIHKRFVFISAIIPNLQEINNWLGGDSNTLVNSNYRPTQLEYAFLEKMGKRHNAYLLNVNPTSRRPLNYQLYRYLDSKDIELVNNENKKIRLSSKKAISVAVALKAAKAGPVALFAPHKSGNSGVEGIANEMIKQLSWTNNRELIDSESLENLHELEAYFSKIFGNDYLLASAIQFGFVFHHGDFPQYVREIIEDTLRTGLIKVVICTNTLAEGVNLPIRTIVIHSTRRFNPNVIGNYETLRSRDLKNLVGRAGRAGKETKGLIIIPHENDFQTIRNLINETDIGPVKGQLYNLIKPLTEELAKKRLVLSDELLETLQDPFKKLFDSVELALIDLLAEEIEADQLIAIIKEMVSNTFSYFQSSTDEKDTLEKIFLSRSKRLIPIIKTNEFKILKNSGATISLFEEIIEKIDFSNELWFDVENPIDERWLNFILNDAIFKLGAFTDSLTEFNGNNGCDITPDQVKAIIVSWMNGDWFDSISENYNLEMYQVLRLINNYISYDLQSILSSTIRLAEQKNVEKEISKTILNWPSFIQLGINNQLMLDLVELGLTDREAILHLNITLAHLHYVHVDYSSLRQYLISEKNISKELLERDIPMVSLKNIDRFIKSIIYKELL